MSDESFSAICDAAVEIEREGDLLGVVRSTPSGAIHADISPGSCDLTFSARGHGAKRSRVEIANGRVHQFRLLTERAYGYAWPKWVKSGERSEFRVHSVTAYHLSLWRYGLKRELIRPIGWFDEHGPRATSQVLPDCDFTQTGVQWNRRGYRCAPFPADGSGQAEQGALFAPQTVQAPQRSGLYFFHAHFDSGEFVSFPWVVAPLRPTAKLAILASTNTWNAYNNFGGRSNYINADALPARPTVNARLDLGRYDHSLKSVWQRPDDAYMPLSFDRPEPFSHIPEDVHATDPIRGRQACHLVETEWRLLAWLEREGVAYDLYSDQQLDDGTLDLDAYKALVISTHPEYWSRSQFDRVRDWTAQRGGNLLYLGGNGVDCEITYPTSSTMRCKNWWPEPPGVPWRDPATGVAWDCRMHRTTGISPAEMLGVVFTEPGCATAAPFEVLDANHWAFAGTGVANAEVFGRDTLHERCPGGASGHETDKRSPHSPNTIDVIARGLNADNGGSEITCHETPSGGSVFSVGSITWPAALLIDPVCSRMTRNAIDRALSQR